MLIHPLKVILCQLPQIDIWRRKRNKQSNIPLAAGYLKAMAYKEGLFNQVDIEILDCLHNDLDGDDRLVDVITSKKPSVLGMSLYPWNAVRSLSIAGEVKNNLPNLKVIVGGPEVTAETLYILSSPNVDIGVLGEGEVPFVNLLKFFLEGDPDLSKIEGIFYRKSGKTIISKTSLFSLKDIDEIPSPYLLGYIDVKKYGRMMIETVRGCPYRCKYCSVYKRSSAEKPFFSLARIKQELKLAKNEGIKLIDLHDAAFNISPKFKEIAKVIQEINFDKSMALGVELMAELIDKETADLLEKCNVKFCEVGLQSTNPEVLSNIGRTADLSKFLEGVKLLKSKGIRLSINVIIGLPGDDLKSFKETINFLTKNQLLKDVVFPSILSVGPAIELRKESTRFGLKYQPEPSYRVIETKTFPYKDIKSALRLCFSLFFTGHSGYLFYPSMATYIKSDYPGEEKEDKNFGDYPGDMPNYPVTKIIFDPQSQISKFQNMDLWGENLSKCIANTVTIWFKVKDFRNEIKPIKFFLSSISKKNPYVIWNIILESECNPPLLFINELQNSIFYKMNNLDYESFFLSDKPIGYKRQGTRIFVVISGDNSGRVNEGKLRELKKNVAAIFWSVDFEKDKVSPRKITNIFKKAGDGLLVDFQQGSDFHFIFRILKLLQRKYKPSQKNIFFKNYILQQVWELSAEKMPVSLSEKENVVILNPDSSRHSFFFQTADILPVVLKLFLEFKNFDKTKKRL